ncbi:MAG: biotin--[acetyl-CoA-carboxylase] ligase [Eubacteriales bacterium]|nr:biotin--[acetyl-CoA-carboxylase] ligase [Eubacteriales bacterium]
MNKLDELAIRKHLPASLRDIEITLFDSIDSTNSYAKQLDVDSVHLIVSDTQTGGRGRVGKSFFSPEGSGIYMTLALKEQETCDFTTVIAAVAVVRVIIKRGTSNVGIKWVNDIFHKGRKVCGILCERKENTVIIGIGLNLFTTVFPDDIAEIAGSLELDCDRNGIIAEITAELFKVKELNPQEIIREYKSHLFILGKEIEYIRNGTVKKGIATDINEYANLIVKTKDGEDILSSGEISLKSKNFAE